MIGLTLHALDISNEGFKIKHLLSFNPVIEIFDIDSLGMSQNASFRDF